MSFGFKLSSLKKTIEPVEDKYDVVIVGAGPAGLTAAIYCARYQLKIVVIAESIGGSMSEAPLVDDYPGLPDIPGVELTNRFVKHVEKYHVPIITDTVVNITRADNGLWLVETKSNRRIYSYAVILAIGSVKRKLNVPGEERLIGKGVSYCATCDAPFFKNKTVAVVGGGNSALTSALYLSNLASKVFLIHRRDKFRAFEIYVKQVLSNPRIEVLLNTIVKEIIGEDKVEAVKVENVVSGETRILNVDGVFIEIGSEPPREFFEKIGVEIDEKGYAKVNPDQSTNLPGIYVAGDAAGGPFKYRFEQIITACAEGAKAADSAFKYILRIKSETSR